MAIYYINPHTTTNGDGSFASPWSLSSTTRTGLAAGDEIRIFGVALTSLLTATSYTATVASRATLTITAGGGLGADWALYDVCYIQELDVFFKVTSKSGNVIGVQGSANMLPLRNTAVTTYTLRRVNLASYPVSTTSNTYSILALSNMTVSDCWTNATTRVTDGSVKTLFNTSTTNTTITSDFITAFYTGISNVTFNLNNTHIIGSNSTSSSITTPVTVNGRSININLNQTNPSGSVSNNMGIGGTLFDSTITIKQNGGNIVRPALYGANTVINVENCNLYEGYLILYGGANGSNTNVNFTYNIGDVVYDDNDPWAVALLVSSLTSFGTVVNYNGVIDRYRNGGIQTILTAFGPMTLNFGSSFVFYNNRRANTQTSVNQRWYSFATPQPNTALGKMFIPDVPLPPGWTSFNYLAISANQIQVPNSYITNNPSSLEISFPAAKVSNQSFRQQSLSATNFLYTFRDGSNPVEYLAVDAGYPSTIEGDQISTVTTNSVVFRTTGPSLKANLVTYVTAVWEYNNTKAYKTIKIPVVNGESYTVTGYIRCDDATYVNGDCVVAVVAADGTEIDSQSMTTSCINAWEQFTLTFTASQTEELALSWGMHWSNGGKSFYLDDLTIT